MMWDHIGPIAAVLALLLSAITVGLGALLKFSMSRMETSLAQAELTLRKAINDTAKEIDERIDAQGRQFGETVQALRQKINDVELYIRDTYVRRESFHASIQELAKRIENRIDRLENKMNGGD